MKAETSRANGIDAMGDKMIVQTMRIMKIIIMACCAGLRPFRPSQRAWPDRKDAERITITRK